MSDSQRDQRHWRNARRIRISGRFSESRLSRPRLPGDWSSTGSVPTPSRPLEHDAEVSERTPSVSPTRPVSPGYRTWRAQRLANRRSMSVAEGPTARSASPNPPRRPRYLDAPRLRHYGDSRDARSPISARRALSADTFSNPEDSDDNSVGMPSVSDSDGAPPVRRRSTRGHDDRGRASAAASPREFGNERRQQGHGRRNSGGAGSRSRSRSPESSSTEDEDVISRLSSTGSLGARRWRTPPQAAAEHTRSSSLEGFLINKNRTSRGLGDHRRRGDEKHGRGTASNREHGPDRRHRRASSWSNPRDRVTPGGPGDAGRQVGEGSGSRLQILDFDDTDMERGRRNALTRDNVTLLSMLYSGDDQDSGSESSFVGRDYDGTDDEDVGDVTSLFGFSSPRRGGGRRTNNKPARRRGTPSPHRRSTRSPHGRSASYDLAKSPRHDRRGVEKENAGLAERRRGYHRRNAGHRRALTNISDMLAALADEGTVEVDDY